MNMVSPRMQAHGVECTRTSLLLSLILELTAVVEEENLLLAQGIPATLTYTTVEKLRLSRQIHDLMADPDNQRRTASATDEQRRLLADRIRHAEQAVSENAGRLSGAITATKRRIEALMAAIREKMTAESSGYTGEGRLPGGSATADRLRGRLA